VILPIRFVGVRRETERGIIKKTIYAAGSNGSEHNDDEWTLTQLTMAVNPVIIII
jgi:hypothetical protein